MPDTASVEPKIASAMPASPQHISSLTIGHMRPVGSANAFGAELHGVEPDPGGLLDDGPRRLLALVPLVGGGADDVLGEVVDPLLDLELVLVEVEGEGGHRALLTRSAQVTARVT